MERFAEDAGTGGFTGFTNMPSGRYEMIEYFNGGHGQAIESKDNVKTMAEWILSDGKDFNYDHEETLKTLTASNGVVGKRPEIWGFGSRAAPWLSPLLFLAIGYFLTLGKRPMPVASGLVAVMWLFLTRGFDRRFHLREAFFEVAADQLVHVHEQAGCLGHEVVVTGHAPDHLGSAAFRFKVEFGGVCGFEGLDEFEFDPDKIAGLAAGEGHAAYADLLIAGPFVDGTHAGGRARIRFFHRRIELFPRRPGGPVMKIVHLGKYIGGRRSNGDASLDAEIGGLHGNHTEKHDDDRSENERDFLEHDGGPPDSNW
jgi:hypothetical protein